MHFLPVEILCVGKNLIVCSFVIHLCYNFSEFQMNTFLFIFPGRVNRLSEANFISRISLDDPKSRRLGHPAASSFSGRTEQT